MSDSTTLLDLISESQAGKATAVNALLDAASPVILYARRASTTAGLTWGYYGGRVASTLIANGTVTLTASAANYVVAHRTTGAVSVSTATTNWNDATTYRRLHKIVTGTLSVTDYEDHREASGGGGTSFTGGSLTSAINEAKGANIASAATTDLGAATGNLVHVTGTTTITALGTVQAGTRRIVVFDGILTLTHNATSLILPTSANITTAAGDMATFVSEGSGNWRCVVYQRASGAALAGAGGGSLTHFTEGLSSASPNATVPVVSLAATHAATNVDVAIVTKGTGALMLRVPDDAATGGGKRGARAVDLQTERAAAVSVAAGAGAFLGPASFSRVGGDNGAVLNGSTNFANGQFSTVLNGSTNTASGLHSLITHGSNNLADADYSMASGFRAVTRAVYGSQVFASGRFSVDGDAQRMHLTLRRETSNATATELTSNNSAAAATNQMVLVNNSAYIVRGSFVAREAATGDTKSWDFVAHIKRGANAAATVMVAAVTPTVIANDTGAAAWALTVTADTTGGALVVKGAGEAGKTIRWLGTVSAQQLVG